MNNNDCRMIQFEKNSNETGQLVYMEAHKEIPFSIKRIYYIYGVPSYETRGFHAHKNLQQVLIAISGSLEVAIDNGYEKKNFTLSSPQQGLFVNSRLWRKLSNFSTDAICLVLASAYFNVSDYIRDYNVFLNYISGAE